MDKVQRTKKKPADNFRTLPAGYRISFAEVQRPGRGVNRPAPSNAEVKERVELYHYFSSRSSWCSGANLTFTIYLLPDDREHSVELPRTDGSNELHFIFQTFPTILEKKCKYWESKQHGATNITRYSSMFEIHNTWVNFSLQQCAIFLTAWSTLVQYTHILRTFFLRPSQVLQSLRHSYGCAT